MRFRALPEIARRAHSPVRNPRAYPDVFGTSVVQRELIHSGCGPKTHLLATQSLVIDCPQDWLK